MYNVLIVDDEPLIREGICYGIEWDRLYCNEPLCAENGLEAVEIIKNSDVDIVITDIRMPGLNGIELAKWIHENYSRTKVIMLTGYDEFSYAQSALRFSVIDFILKPTKLEEIELAVEKSKKLLAEEDVKKKLVNEAQKVIYENELRLRALLIENIINGRVSEPDVIRNRMAELNFNPCIYRLALLGLTDGADNSVTDSADASCYIEYLQSILMKQLNESRIECIFHLEREFLIAFFYTEGRNSDRTVFSEETKSALEKLRKNVSEFIPYKISFALSSIDLNMSNIKGIYFETLKKLDVNKGNILNGNPHEKQEGSDKDDFLGSEFQELVYRRDIQGIFNKLEQYFKKLNKNCITYMKSTAIEMINFVLRTVHTDIADKGVGSEEIYAKIINCEDLFQIQQVLKESIRVIYSIAEDGSQKNDSEELSERIISHIKYHYNKNLTLEDVAEKFYLSPVHLNRLLKKNCGKTFLDILTHIRIKNAEILLRNPKYKAYEVANLVGFKDSKYFSQVFKKYTGKTPSEFK